MRTNEIIEGWITKDDNLALLLKETEFYYLILTDLKGNIIDTLNYSNATEKSTETIKLSMS